MPIRSFNSRRLRSLGHVIVGETNLFSRLIISIHCHNPRYNKLVGFKVTENTMAGLPRRCRWCGRRSCKWCLRRRSPQSHAYCVSSQYLTLITSDGEAISSPSSPPICYRCKQTHLRHKRGTWGAAHVSHSGTLPVSETLGNGNFPPAFQPSEASCVSTPSTDEQGDDGTLAAEIPGDTRTS